jgi:alkylation response protein AidB-like acyl-CoA dehydrogenase
MRRRRRHVETARAEVTWHAAEATFAIFGSFAFAEEYDIERKWREVRLYQTAPISTNLILAYLGSRPARLGDAPLVRSGAAAVRRIGRSDAE